MTKKTSIFLMMIFLVAAALMMTACGGSGGEEGEKTEEGAEGEVTTPAPEPTPAPAPAPVTTEKAVEMQAAFTTVQCDKKFDVRIAKVTFNFPADGTVKPAPENQVVELQVEVNNTSDKKIGVRRIDFRLNELDQEIGLTQASDEIVLNVEPGQSVAFKNYYQVPATIQEIKDLKVVYHDVDANGTAVAIDIPLMEAAPAVPAEQPVTEPAPTEEPKTEGETTEKIQ